MYSVVRRLVQHLLRKKYNTNQYSEEGGIVHRASVFTGHLTNSHSTVSEREVREGKDDGEESFSGNGIEGSWNAC